MAANQATRSIRRYALGASGIVQRQQRGRLDALHGKGRTDVADAFYLDHAIPTFVPHTPHARSDRELERGL